MGFQISQYDFPIASKGTLLYSVMDASGQKVADNICGITRLHMENDAGKLTHRGTTTLCDYNRAGTPLMEIVTEPDLRSADEAVAFAQELRRLLIAMGASEADMFKGMMRFDASISLREIGTEKLNPRSEIKNLNSFKALDKALQYEEKRLRKAWANDGGPLPNDITVGWLDDQEKTKMLRNKESADDYRYMPEPDIPPLEFTQKEVDAIAADLPLLPQEKKKQYTDIGLDDAQSLQLIDQSALQLIFDAVFAKTNDAKRASSLVLTQLLGFLNAHEKDVSQGPDSERMLELIGKIDDGTISANAGKDVLEKMITSGKNASSIIEEEGMQQISDDSAIESMVQAAIDANPKAIEDFKAGNEKAIGAIVGFVMKESKGQANPTIVNKILQDKLTNS